MPKRPKPKVKTTTERADFKAKKAARHQVQVDAAVKNEAMPILAPWNISKELRKLDRINKGYPQRWANNKAKEAAKPSVSNLLTGHGDKVAASNKRYRQSA